MSRVYLFESPPRSTLFIGVIVMRRIIGLSLVSALSAAALMAMPGASHAAESYDNCNNFIDTLPANIGTQGVWCLRKDLSTAMTSGEAIKISTNNVTIDCNGFKVGGLAAGPASKAIGIYALQQKNITVRNCNVRGFGTGIHINGGAGHLVELNRIDQSLQAGLLLGGLNIGLPVITTNASVIRRNTVYDTGSAGTPGAYGIFSVGADVIENTVAGVFADDSAYSQVYGIFSGKDGADIRGNRIRDLGGASFVLGIEAAGADIKVEDNQVYHSLASGSTTGVNASGTGVSCRNNTVGGFSTAIADCLNGGGNGTN